MSRNRHRQFRQAAIAVLSATLFLAFTVASPVTASAAETWETWPKKAVEPGIDSKPAAPVPPPSGSGPAASAGKAAGEKTAEGMSAGTIGWIALGAAAVVGIAVAAGGGGGSSSAPACSQ